MTIYEASRRYNIPIEILREYERWRARGTDEELRQYDDEDIRRLSVMMTLRDAGLSGDETEAYMKLLTAEKDTADQRLKIIKCRRDSTLCEIHSKQEQLDRLDYLRYKIQKENKF